VAVSVLALSLVFSDEIKYLVSSIVTLFHFFLEKLSIFYAHFSRIGYSGRMEKQDCGVFSRIADPCSLSILPSPLLYIMVSYFCLISYMNV
jgi:hypothetical protein